MKKNRFIFFPFFLFCITLYSCKDKKIQKFKITIVLSHDLGSSVGDPLNNGLKLLCNYFTDTACGDKVFVPSIAVIRPDVNPERADSIVVPLSSLNKMRQSINLLSAPNLTEDYDENVPKLTTPEIVALKSQQPVNVDVVMQNYPDCKKVLIGDSMVMQIEKLTTEISQDLCSKSGGSYTILFYAEPSTAVAPTQGVTQAPGAVEGDDCRYDFCKAIKKKLLEIGTCGTVKKYEERFLLAKNFADAYLTDKTQIELLSPEGLSVDSYRGKKAKAYIFELADENRCVLDFKIPVITTTGDGKISLLRIREYDKK